MPTQFIKQVLHSGEQGKYLTVRAEQSRLKTVRLWQSFVTFMCCPFREDIAVDWLASKIVTLFHLNLSAVENEILTLQAKLKSRAHGQFWNSQKKKCPNMRKCASSLMVFFGSIFIYELAFYQMKIMSALFWRSFGIRFRLATTSYCSPQAKQV